MDFHALVAKMKQLESSPTTVTDGCGDSMPPMANEPVAPPPPPPSMSVNLNAQGMDNIESMMKLFQRVNPDMMPKVSPMPSIMPEPSIASIKPSLPPLKMLPDFDADNDDKPGGEMDMDGPDLDKKDPMDVIVKMDSDKDRGEQPGGLAASLDRDGDGDHDMKDHELEKDQDDSDSDDEEDKKEAYANEPDECEGDIDYMNNKLAGGMNRPKATFPKVATGDNPMQGVRESEDSIRDQIKADLRRRLEEAKGAK